MKPCLLLLFVAFHYSSISQVSDSCIGSQLKEVDVYLQLNGFSYEDSLYLRPDTFKDKIELKSPNSGATVRGFYILANCGGCDIMEFSICGTRVPEKYLKKLDKFFASQGGWLEFYSITIEIQGRKYFARPFMVFPKN